jgi:hypothetical protein
LIRWYHNGRDDVLVGVIETQEHYCAYGQCVNARQIGGVFLDVEPGLRIDILTPFCWDYVGQVYGGSKYLRFFELFAEETGCAVWNEDHVRFALEDRRTPRSRWPKPLASFNWNSTWYMARSFSGLWPHEPCEKCRLMTAQFWGKRRGRRDSKGVADVYKYRTHSRCRNDMRRMTLEGTWGLFLNRCIQTKDGHRWRVPHNFQFPSWFDWETFEENQRIEKQLKALRENKKLLAKARKALKGKHEHTTKHTGGTDEQAGQGDSEEGHGRGCVPRSDGSVQGHRSEGCVDGP